MADIQKLTYPYFTDGTTQLNAANLNPIIQKLNEVIDKVNGGVTPTQTVATPTISISGTTATITCSTSGATIRYAIDGTPTESSGTIIASGSTINLSSYNTQKTIRAIAYKSGMTTSQVAQATYTPSASEEPETAQILARYTKSISSAQRSALNTFVASLKSSGVYSKIEYLILPFMAANSSEAVQDALGNENGTANNAASVTLANNAISPTIDADIASISGIEDLDTGLHLSYFTVDAPTLAVGKWDIAIGTSTSLNTGKNTNNNGIGLVFTDSEGNQDQRWTPTEVASYNTTAKTHIVNTGDSSKVAISVNGTYVAKTDKALKTDSNSKTVRLFLSAGATATTYKSTAEGTTLGTASQFKYGLLSIGQPLSETECIAFNNAVTTLMNVIFS